MRESDLYGPVKIYLEEADFEVFTEVLPQASNIPYFNHGRADIVAICRPVLAVVELKNTLSLDLIAQAVRWKGFANQVFVATPYPKMGYNRFALKLLKQEGIGLLAVQHEYVRMRLSPRTDSRAITTWKSILNDDYKELPGGHSGGGYLTIYKKMIRNIKEYLRIRKSQWVPIENILDSCHTHYAHPKQSLASALIKIEHAWCESKKENGKLYFRYNLKGGVLDHIDDGYIDDRRDCF